MEVKVKRNDVVTALKKLDFAIKDDMIKLSEGRYFQSKGQKRRAKRKIAVMREKQRAMEVANEF